MTAYQQQRAVLKAKLQREENRRAVLLRKKIARQVDLIDALMQLPGASSRSKELWNHVKPLIVEANKP